MLETYLIVLGGVALAQIAPGPNLVAVAGAALAQDLATALFLALGVATATLVWVGATAFGLAALLDAFPALMTAMKLLGGGYLCFVAAKAFAAAARGRALALDAVRTSLTPPAAWRRGFLINMSNPKSALTWGAVATFMFGSGLSMSQVVGFAPIGAASAFLVYGAYALLFSSGFAKRAYLRFAHVLQAFFGLAFGAIGVRLLSDGLRDLLE